MAKAIGNGHKVAFGKRRNGKAKKNRNKHDHKSKTYRGQGR